jgi:UDP-N-acetylglucosamine 2-epimerase
MKNLVAVFGTRPELIKLWPLVDAFRGVPDVTLRLVFTRQHDSLVEALLPPLGIEPDVRLEAPRAAPLSARTADLMAALGQWFHSATPRPDAVLVQGDTASTLAGAMSAFYAGIPVVHVEAGLRSGLSSEPFPEELHRQTISRIASLHLSPTNDARANLLREGIAPESIVVTGNTGIDAVMRVTAAPPPGFESADRGRYVLATLHRRESAGEVARGIARALRDAHRTTDAPVVVVLHASPDARRPLEEVLSELEGVRLLQPQSYPQMAWLLRHSALIVTDSGGLQEEAAALGIPALVVRRQTDRPETVDHGNARVVGVQPDVVTEAIVDLWREPERRRTMSTPSTACGDGRAAERSVRAILEWLKSPRP